MPSRRTLSLFALVSLLALVAFVSAPPRDAVAHQEARFEEAIFFSPVCPHDGFVVVSMYKCPDSAKLQLFHGADIQSMSVTIKLKNKTSVTQDIPAGTDALFLSNVAITKFLRPYYVRVGDTKKSAALLAFTNKLVRMDRARTQAPRAPAR